nr:MAG TPA: hypothetical protein [Caudoviricetes sp.]
MFAPRVSGIPNNGTNVGAFYWNLNSGATTANWNCGARVLKILKLHNVFLVAWQKLSRIWISLVAPFERKINRQKKI